MKALLRLTIGCVFLTLPASAGSLDGQTVTSVRIEGPEQIVTRIARLVEVRADQPFRSADVRHSVEVLYATGELADVVVDAVSHAHGVEIVFRLVPAPRLAAIRVEGATVVTAKDVGRITHLRTGEIVWPAQLAKAAADIGRRLQSDGFLEAQVTANSRPAAAGVDAVFRVDAGARVFVRKASLEGLADGSGPAVAARRMVQSLVGRAFRRSQAERVAERMKQRLVSARRWRAKVELRESYDRILARMDLAFLVQPGPSVVVEFSGERPPSAIRSRVEQILREGALKGDVLEEAADFIEETYRRSGHREASVRHQEVMRGDVEAVIYEIDPGPEARVASVTVSGLEEVPEADRPVGLIKTAVGAPPPLVEQLLEQDARALQKGLEDAGYSDADVELELSEGGGLVPVTYRVRPGPRTMLNAVTVASPVLLPAEEPHRELRCRPGRSYRVADVARDRNELLTAYRNAGYPQVEIIPEETFSDDRKSVRLTFQVMPGTLTRVDHIIISGLKRTREEVVRRELALHEGDPLGTQKVLESQRRLGALGIFGRVAVAEIDPESIGQRSLVVAAEEAPLTTVAYGIGYGERDLVRASLEVTRRNLSGLDRSLTAFGRASFRGNRLLATYREPYLFGRKQELLTTAFREEEDRETFDFIRYGGLFQGAHRLAPQWSLITRWAYQKTRVFRVAVPLDEVDRRFQNSTVSGPSFSVVNDTRNDPLEPTRGRFVGADIQFSHEIFGGDSFAKLFLQTFVYQRLTRRATIALGGRVGMARTLGYHVPLRLPLPERFFAGGDYTIRGFGYDTAGPLETSTSGTLVPTGGNAMVIGNAELRFDLGRNFQMAAFSDVGNVYPLLSDMSLSDMRTTAGLGLRYRSALGPLRVDWGYKLNRRPGEERYKFHFTVGHAF